MSLIEEGRCFENKSVKRVRLGDYDEFGDIEDPGGRIDGFPQ